MFCLEFDSADAVCFVPVNLRAFDFAVVGANTAKRFHFSPTNAAIKPSETDHFTNRRANGDDFRAV